MDLIQAEELRLYLGDEVKIADGVSVKCPSIGQIAKYGEANYFGVAQMLCATPSSYKVQLDDMKLDWMKVSDFELFIMLSQGLKPEQTSLLLGDLDLSSLKPYAMNDGEEVVLSNSDHSIIINEVIYNILVEYLRKIHGFKKQVDKAGNDITKMVLLRVARDDAKKAANKPYKSFLTPLISAVKCRMGYTVDYVKSMNIYEFMSDLSRLNVIQQADAALSGMYSGFVDTKRMDKTVLDWTRDITEESNTKNKTILKEGAN
jgi:hypothetical protein